MPNTVKEPDGTATRSLINSIISKPPKPLDGSVICDWHKQLHGGREQAGTYRTKNDWYEVTWKVPYAEGYERRRYPACPPGQIADEVDAACGYLEAYAREPARGDHHVNVSATNLTWMMSRLVRAWPFDSYNEQVAMLAFQAGVVRLGFSPIALSLARHDVRQEFAYSIVPRRIQPPSNKYFLPRVSELLKAAAEPGSDSPQTDGFADAISGSHAAFSRSAAEESVDKLNAGEAKPKVPSDWFLAGANSRAGRRAPLRFHWIKRQR